MDSRYELIVIGTGVAASTVASRVRNAGRSVAIVDFRPFGGTCVLRGCDPKRVLMSGAETVSAVERMYGRGVSGEVAIRWPELMAFKRTFTDPIPSQRESQYAAEGINAFHGRARFTGRNSITVEGTALEARHIVLATGAEPVKLGIPGEQYLTTSEQFLSLERLPPRVVFVGGGYIAAELSHLSARSGARVTVLQRGERMLPLFEPKLVDWLMDSFRAAGIDVHTRTSAEAIERVAGSTFRVHASSGGKSQTFEGDLVVHAAGRAPELDILDLPRAGVVVNNGRIELNEYLQSVSNPAVYAAGDAARKGPELTPIAGLDGDVVATNLLEGNRRPATYVAIPSVAFTIPPIASVGLSEEQAHQDGRKFRTNCQRASDWYTARRVCESVYGFKVLIEEGSGHILGAHLVGPGVEETINLFALAIRFGLTADDLKQTIFSYPTCSSDLVHMVQ